jgi:hypothetical protein
MPVVCQHALSDERVKGVYLRLVERFLVDFLVEGLGDSSTLQDAVLSEEKPVFEGEFSERKGDNEALPWEERPVEPARQALGEVRIDL